MPHDEFYALKVIEKQRKIRLQMDGQMDGRSDNTTPQAAHRSLKTIQS